MTIYTQMSDAELEAEIDRLGGHVQQLRPYPLAPPDTGADAAYQAAVNERKAAQEEHARRLRPAETMGDVLRQLAAPRR